MRASLSNRNRGSITASVRASVVHCGCICWCIPSLVLRLSPVLLAAYQLAFWGQPAFSQEDVVHRRSGIVMHGKIVSYDSTGVRLQFGTSKEPKFIPADEIERVEVKLTPDQQEGERLYEQKDYRAAVEKLESALHVETRSWLRARLGSEIVFSYVGLGDSIAAIDSFFTASQASEGQIQWTAVPVWWLPESPGGGVTGHALSLLRSNNPMQQVIGASYLFGTEHSGVARDALAKLTTYRDERVGQLARTQLWRWEAAHASAEDVSAWQRQAAKLPGDFRGGPFFAIGLALKRLGQHEDAALAFLWPAWVYKSDPRLSARAALLAAESLAQAGQRSEARQVYEELIARYSRSAEAATAQERLNALKE